LSADTRYEPQQQSAGDVDEKRCQRKGGTELLRNMPSDFKPGYSAEDPADADQDPMQLFHIAFRF
jgi:hypothetical protein